MFGDMPDNGSMSSPSSSQGSAMLTVLIDNQSQLEFDRNKVLPDNQLAYLDRMDVQMDAGVRLGGVRVEQPDLLQRAQFVAVHLIEALQQGNEALIAASCAWLAQRLPDLKQVKTSMLDDGFSVDLVFDEPYATETIVEFVPRPVS